MFRQNTYAKQEKKKMLQNDVSRNLIYTTLASQANQLVRTKAINTVMVSKICM